MTDVLDLGLVELADAVRTRQLSPVEIVDHYLGRVEREDAALGAFITVTADQARAAARGAERTLLTTADAHDLPPLHGVPTAIKDLIRVQGVRCTFGSKAFVDHVADVEDGVATRLREAGLIFLGQTNTAEFGISCYTENLVAPPARSPWDRARSAGGSSGGAAAAVAAGLVPAAHASDGGGSVRIPAAACGLVGLKPSRGVVSPGPHGGDISGMGTNGSIARSVQDVAALLDAMTGGWPGDPHRPPPRPDGGYLSDVDQPPGQLRVGCSTAGLLADVGPDAEVQQAISTVRTLLAELGHVTEDAPLGAGPEVVPAFEQVWAVGVGALELADETEALLLPLTRWQRATSRQIDAVSYARAQREMQAVARRIETAWAPYDGMLLPTLAAPPALVGAIRDDDDPAADFAAQETYSPYCVIANITGRPAIQLPLHWSSEGVPIGIQVVGRLGADAQLLALAAQLEQARPWRDRRPPGWSEDTDRQ